MGRRKNPWNATSLRKLYLTQRLTTGQIASRLRCSDEAVRRQLIRLGIERRPARFPAGKNHPDYIDGRSFLGYQKRGYNPWNKGRCKATDKKVLAISNKIRRTFKERGIGWKPWRTRRDATIGLRSIAASLRAREARKYAALLSRLGPGWVTEFFIDDFVFRKPDGKWTGIIADLANPKTKQMIEIDGIDHEDEKRAASDKRRDKFLKKLGWSVRRIKETP